MKGIILAGGNGTRLYPITQYVNKHLLPVYDKPMIHYPLACLMSMGIRDIFIVCGESQIELLKSSLGNGSNYGISIEYGVQNDATGIAAGLLVGESFVKDDNVTLILGDNIFYGLEVSHQYLSDLNLFETYSEQVYIFSYRVKDPHRYGIVEFDDKSNVISIEEKPERPRSNHAVTGLYIYDHSVFEKAKRTEASKRGEHEISDVNRMYLESGKLTAIPLKRGFSWLDSGTVNSLMEASNFVRNIQDRQGVKISCLEEIALNRGYIDHKGFLKLLEQYHKNSDYYYYLCSIIN